MRLAVRQSVILRRPVHSIKIYCSLITVHRASSAGMYYIDPVCHVKHTGCCAHFSKLHSDSPLELRGCMSLLDVHESCRIADQALLAHLLNNQRNEMLRSKGGLGQTSPWNYMNDESRAEVERYAAELSRENTN